MSEEQYTKPKVRPNVRQKKLVKELVNNPTQTQGQAYAKVYGVTNLEVASDRASRVLAKPHVQEHIRDVIDREYPQMAGTCARVLEEFLTNDMLSPQVRMKAIEMLAKFYGWAAPTESRNLKLTANLDKVRKLPGTE